MLIVCAAGVLPTEVEGVVCVCVCICEGGCVGPSEEGHQDFNGRPITDQLLISQTAVGVCGKVWRLHHYVTPGYAKGCKKKHAEEEEGEKIADVVDVVVP